MKTRKAGGKLAAGLLSAGLLLGAGTVSPAALYADQSADRQDAPLPAAIQAIDYTDEPYFSEVLAEWTAAGIADATTAVAVEAGSPARVSDPQTIRTGDYRGKANVLIWRADGRSWVEYEVEVAEAGLYEIEVAYHPLVGEGGNSPVQWEVTLDGQRPFREASSISLYRAWQDTRPILTNADGDQIRPRSVDVSEWRAAPLTDSTGAYSYPLKWYLDRGKHTIRLAGHEPVALAQIRLLPATAVAGYEEAGRLQPQTAAIGGAPILLQAEDFHVKNDTAIKLYSDKNVRTVPRYRGRITYNTVGGFRWIEQNQEIVWKFAVPETGRYKLAFRALQNTIAQKTSYRKIKIDGVVPFEPFLAYGFPYAAKWQSRVLADRSGEPYLVYLEAGEHTLSLSVTHAPVHETIVCIEALSSHLDQIDWDLRKITSANSRQAIDRNRSWDVEKEFPGLLDRLQAAAEGMERVASQVAAANGGKDAISQGLETSAKDIRTLLRKPEEIPYHVEEISSMREKFGTFIDSLFQQPLQLDEVYIIPELTEPPELEAGLLDGIWGSLQNFYYSFDARDSLRRLDDDKLNIWVQRGRDYVDQLQQLADESFTPETGIAVKVNLLPNPELLLMSNAAGIQPDIALGLTQDLPVDYAIRGSLYDLSKFDDFAQTLYPQFSPGSWLPLYYDGGYYGVPETQSFQVLYYRKDILERLGASIPQTWEEVYLLLPTLQQNFMNFYLNPLEFAHFFYQNGAEFYSRDGLRSGLDAPEAFQAFKQWTDLYNTYAVEKEVPSFYQHFRKGTMPVGISDYNMYVQLAAAAPELNGRWGIAQIPGIAQPDGTISRWAGGGQRTGVIFERSDKKEEAWQFLRWWLSADVQAQYGSDLEAVNGVAFRWNTSNVEAFARLPWKKEDAEVILKQWSWYKDIPNVPGGYFLQREVGNAWNRTVVSATADSSSITNYLASLEQAVRDINRELLRKQQEFGFIDAQGNKLKALAIPAVDRPWGGIDRYVE